MGEFDVPKVKSALLKYGATMPTVQTIEERTLTNPTILEVQPLSATIELSSSAKTVNQTSLNSKNRRQSEPPKPQTKSNADLSDFVMNQQL